MKTFREMISWELEQEKKGARTLQITTEEAAGKLGSCILRKLRYLSSSAEPGPKTEPELKPFC
jgi:hypothetical protein